MLIILNIVIIVFLLGMIFIWSTYGLYSAVLNLIVTIAAGILALALWEPVSFWLLGRIPAYAHGVGLLAPFMLSLVILRAVVDRLCRMNVRVPRLADQIGGGAVGVVSGVLAMGMFLNGANFMPITREAFGWEPYNIQGNKFVDSDEGGLLLAVNEWSGTFFTMLSGGSMSPIGGPSIAEARPDLAKRAIAYRLAEDENQSRAAHPDNVQVTGLYAVPATEAVVRGLVDRATLLRFISTGYEMPDGVAFGQDGLGLNRALYAELAKEGSAEMLNTEQIQAVSNSEAYRFPNAGSPDNLERFVGSVSAKLGAELVEDMQSVLNENSVLVFVDTRWKSDTAGAYDADNALRLALTQVALQTSSDRGVELVQPIGFSVEYSQNSKARTFTQAVSDQHFSAFSRFPEFSMGLAFIVPASAEPERLFVRELRFELQDLPDAEGQDSPVNSNLGAVALAMGAPLIDIETEEKEGSAAKNQPSENAVKILGTDTFAELNERLPQIFAGSSAGLEYNQDVDPWTLKSGKRDKMPRGKAGGKSGVRSIDPGSGKRLVRIQVDIEQAKSLYGRALGLAASLSKMTVETQSGQRPAAIGYAYVDANGEMSVDINVSSRRNGGLSVKELPNIRAGEKLFVYFDVPIGEKVISFNVANDELPFESPLEVVKGGRR